MTDDRSLYEAEDVERSEDESRDDSDRRSLIAVLALAVIIIVVVVVLLMSRGCGSVLNTTSRGSATKQIVPVEGLAPTEGSISVWISAGASLESLLANADVAHEGIVDMGGGRFVIKVPEGTEVDAARRLRDTAGVLDAGRVYEDGVTP